MLSSTGRYIGTITEQGRYSSNVIDETGVSTAGAPATITELLCTGGATAGGTSQLLKSLLLQSSGGAVANGTSQLLKAMTLQSSGGATAGGANPLAKALRLQDDGGAVAGGTVALIQANLLPGTIGATLGGSNRLLQSTTLPWTGGWVFGGIGRLTNQSVLELSGGGIFGGTIIPLKAPRLAEHAEYRTKNSVAPVTAVAMNMAARVAGAKTGSHAPVKHPAGCTHGKPQ